jgi:hypothetical protein
MQLRTTIQVMSPVTIFFIFTGLGVIWAIISRVLAASRILIACMDLLWLAAAVIIRIPGFSVNEADESTVVLCRTFTLCYITPVATSDIHKCAVGQTLCVPRTH